MHVRIALLVLKGAYMMRPSPVKHFTTYLVLADRDPLQTASPAVWESAKICTEIAAEIKP